MDQSLLCGEGKTSGGSEQPPSSLCALCYHTSQTLFKVSFHSLLYSSVPAFYISTSSTSQATNSCSPMMMESREPRAKALARGVLLHVCYCYGNMFYLLNMSVYPEAKRVRSCRQRDAIRASAGQAWPAPFLPDHPSARMSSSSCACSGRGPSCETRNPRTP